MINDSGVIFFSIKYCFQIFYPASCCHDFFLQTRKPLSELSCITSQRTWFICEKGNDRITKILRQCLIITVMCQMNKTVNYFWIQNICRRRCSRFPIIFSKMDTSDRSLRIVIDQIFSIGKLCYDFSMCRLFLQ